MKKPNSQISGQSTLDLDKLLTSYQGSLMRYLSYRLRSASDAKDIAQEAYLRLIRVKNSDLIRQPEAYLFRIAANLVSEFQLKNSARGIKVDVDTLDEVGQEGDGDSFEREVETDSSIKKLDKMLAQMPPLYRTVLLMRKRDGYSHEEIAHKLNISKHSVHRYLKSALLKCRTEWTE